MLGRVVLRFFRPCSPHFRTNSLHLSERSKCLNVQCRHISVSWKGYIITVMKESGCPETNVVSGATYLSLPLLVCSLYQGGVQQLEARLVVRWYTIWRSARAPAVLMSSDVLLQFIQANLKTNPCYGRNHFLKELALLNYMESYLNTFLGLENNIAPKAIMLVVDIWLWKLWKLFWERNSKLWDL